MNLLQDLENTFPGLFDHVMQDAGIRLASSKPENRIPLILAASFDKKWKDAAIHTALSTRPIDLKDRLFAVTLKKLTVILAATKFVGRVRVPIYVDLMTGNILAGRFTVQNDTYRPIDREQPVVYGDDEHYRILLHLKLISER